jgi:hypothetical protein
VRIVDPKRVRSFAQSAGRLAKNDAIDAEMIAWFAETFNEAPSQTHDAAREELLALVKARKGLLELKMRLESQSEHAALGSIQKAHARVLKNLVAEIAKLEAAISTKIKATPEFAERAEIIESVPGFAKMTAANLVAGMPELGQVSDEIAAALIGVAPYDDDSGQRRGERHIKGGPPLGSQRHLHTLSWCRHTEQPRAQSLLSTPDCQGKGAEGCAHCLHAQADHHPQHDDRTTAEMESRAPRGGLTSVRRARSSPERMQSQKTGERAGSRPSAAEGGGAQRQP